MRRAEDQGALQHREYRNEKRADTVRVLSCLSNTHVMLSEKHILSHTCASHQDDGRLEVRDAVK